MTGPGSGEPLLEFLDVMRQLRRECAWKAGQTHRSLARYLLEETYETLDAIDAGDRTGDWAHLREELGDLLLQVYFHAVIAEQAGEFTLDDVAAEVIEKMRRRNPHVFGAAQAGGESEAEAAALSAAEINEVWEAVKRAEKQRGGITDGLPPGLPALLYADKMLDRLERAGDPTPAPAPDARAGDLSDLDPGDRAVQMGERLLALVAEARRDGVDPEQALRDAVRRRLPDAEAGPAGH